MSWILFALLAPLFWTFSNFIDKYSLDRYVYNIYDFIFFSTLTGWIFVPILILIFGLPTLTLYSLAPLTLGIVLIFSYGLYGKALELNDTSRVVVMFKLIPVLTLLFGFLLLGQTISILEFTAFIFVLLGALVVSTERSLGKIQFFSGTKWMLLAIITWSIMFVCIDWAMTKMSFQDFIVLDTLGTALAGPIMLLIPKVRKKVWVGVMNAKPQKFGWYFINNLFDLLGQMSIKKALALAPSAGLVTVTMQIQSLYAVLLGVILTIFFPSYILEDISMKNLFNKLIGASLMFTGICILYLIN